MAAVEGSYIGRYFVLGLDILDIVCILDELSFIGRGTTLLFGWNFIVTSCCFLLRVINRITTIPLGICVLSCCIEISLFWCIFLG